MNDASNGTSPRAYSYAEVANICFTAAEADERMSYAVAEHYGIPRTTANSLIKRARNAGHPIPAGHKIGPRANSILDCGTPEGHRKHVRDGDPECIPCADAFKLWNRNRRAERKRVKTGGKPLVADGRVRCACGQVCPNRTALGKHTWAKHDRWPTDAERVVLDTVERAA